MRVLLLETPASCAAGRRARTRRRCARGGAAPPRPGLPARCRRTMPPVGGMVSVARIPNCRVEAGAGRQPVDLRRSADLSGVEGAEPLASPCRGPAKRGPKGYAGLATLEWLKPALRTPPKRAPSSHPEQRAKGQLLPARSAARSFMSRSLRGPRAGAVTTTAATTMIGGEPTRRSFTTAALSAAWPRSAPP